jgi:Zn-dependent peptidase ImmA (M78 family)
MAKSKSLLRRGFKAEAERTSERLRKELGISKFGALCGFDLAEHLGILVCGISDVLPEEDVKKLNDPAKKEKFSALLFKNVDDDSVIIHNNFDSIYRQQSNLMHELAHFVCGHEVPDEIKNINISADLRYYNDVHEEEAIYLGSCLQLPKVALLWKRKERCSEEEISEYYTASVDMVKYRLNTLGLNRQRRSLN